MAFLDSDDIYEPEKLKIQIETMVKCNTIWSHASYIKFSENGKIKMIDTSWFSGRVYPLCLT